MTRFQMMSEEMTSPFFPRGEQPQGDGGIEPVECHCRRFPFLKTVRMRSSKGTVVKALK